MLYYSCLDFLFVTVLAKKLMNGFRINFAVIWLLGYIFNYSFFLNIYAKIIYDLQFIINEYNSNYY